MGFKKPIVSEIARHTYAINEFGMATSFLLTGSERALLIDAGCGMYNIAEIVKELTDLPVTLVLTHGHGDHIGSAGLFDAVFCHPADWDMALNVGPSMIKDYPKMMAAFGVFETYDIKPEDIHPYGELKALKPVREGDVFDLGGRTLYVLETPGHTDGSIVLIDPGERILFSGDACNPNLGIRTTTVETTLRGLKKIRDHRSDFDRNFNGHIGYGSSNVNIAMPEHNLDSDIFICEHILAGDFADFEEHSERPWNGKMIKSAVYRGMRINYDPDRIWDKDMQ